MQFLKNLKFLESLALKGLILKNLITKNLIYTILVLFTFSPTIVLPMGLFGQENEKSQGSEKQDECEVIFAHGYGSSKEQVFGHTQAGIVFKKSYENRFDFPDSPGLKENNRKLDSAKTCFGQESELKVMKEKFNNIMQSTEFKELSGKDNEEKEENWNNKKGQKKVLVAGVSRGAMCTLSGDFPGAIGRFAESPGASLKDVIDFQCKRVGFGWVPCLGRFIHRWLIRPLMFESYNPTGIKPIDQVKKIPIDTPVFISCTKKDALIPASSSAKLAEALIKNRHKEVYFYVSDLGVHANIVTSRLDGLNKDYVKVSNAFLKKIGALPVTFDCDNGTELLEKCRIKSLQDITKIRRQLEWAIWKNCWVQNVVVFGLCAATTYGAALLGKKIVNTAFVSRIINKVAAFSWPILKNLSGRLFSGAAKASGALK